MSYIAKKMFLDYNPLYTQLTLESGRIYSQTLTFFWRIVRKKGIWLHSKSLEKIFNSNNIHSQSSQASVQSFFGALASWREHRKTDPDCRPPHKRKKYYPVTWKKSAIRLKDHNLILSNGKGNQPIILNNWNYALPVQCLLRYDIVKKKYQLVCVYNDNEPLENNNKNIVGIDLGQIHVAACSNGYIFNGRHLRSLKQGRNKQKAKFQSKIDKQKKGSKRRKKTIKSKEKYLKRMKNRVNDCLHKMTSRLVLTQKQNDVKTLVVGDLCGFRQDNDCGKRRNQENHEWSYAETLFQINYKSEREGMNIVLEKEYYTSKTCPKCLNVNNVSGRVYKCKHCGFIGHRDLVGSTNILTKYLGSGMIQVVAAMAPAIHVRYNANMNVARLE